jgi:hypothetical protein
MLALCCRARVPYLLVIVVRELSVIRVPCVSDVTLGFRCSNFLSFFGVRQCWQLMQAFIDGP